MPKLKEVEIRENSMSWTEVNLTENKRQINISVPKRELEEFKKKGMTISKAKLTFKKNSKINTL